MSFLLSQVLVQQIMVQETGVSCTIICHSSQFRVICPSNIEYNIFVCGIILLLWILLELYAWGLTALSLLFGVLALLQIAVALVGMTKEVVIVNCQR